MDGDNGDAGKDEQWRLQWLEQALEQWIQHLNYGIN